MDENSPTLEKGSIVRLTERIPTRYGAGSILIVERDLGAAVLAHRAFSAPVVRIHKLQCELWTPTKKGTPPWKEST